MIHKLKMNHADFHVFRVNLEFDVRDVSNSVRRIIIRNSVLQKCFFHTCYLHPHYLMVRQKLKQIANQSKVYSSFLILINKWSCTNCSVNCALIYISELLFFAFWKYRFSFLIDFKIVFVWNLNLHFEFIIQQPS